MELADAIRLIQHPVGAERAYWLDLGCGEGLFTRALSSLLPDFSEIIAVDKNETALHKVSVAEKIKLEKRSLDFIREELPFRNLSGVLMANSFHFVENKAQFLKKCSACLGNEGYFLIVEYDTDAANPWVPYPISFRSLQDLFSTFNFRVEKLQEFNSEFNGKMYASIAGRL